MISSAATAGHGFVDCSEEQIRVLNLASSTAVVKLKEANQELRSKLFKRWFGRANPLIVKTANEKMIRLLERGRIIYDCTGKFSDSSNNYAGVFKNRPYVIFIGPAFWTAADDGFDAKFGVIIHELSHFNQVRGTRDIEGTLLGSLELSKLWFLAVYNANNYEYFVESVSVRKMKSISPLPPKP